MLTNFSNIIPPKTKTPVATVFPDKWIPNNTVYLYAIF